MFKKYCCDDGFTLIEIIVVIVIIAVIATIVIPNIVESIDNSRKASDVASARIIADGASRVLALEGKYSGLELSGLNIGSIDDNFVEGGDLEDDFGSKLYSELSGTNPVPVYRGTAVEENNFILVVSSGRTISVYVGNGTDVSSGNALELYPLPSAEYSN